MVVTVPVLALVLVLVDVLTLVLDDTTLESPATMDSIRAM